MSRKGTQMYHILVVEDDPTLNEGISYALKQENFFVYSAFCIKDAKTYLNTKIDLILLDINLPDGDGRLFFKEIHAMNPVPVIFLTARIAEADIIEGFDSGGDDYITKPFSMPILIRRIRALIRRFGMNNKRFYYSGNLEYDYSQKILKKDGVIITLTNTECKLLEVFLENRNMVLIRKLLLEKIWDINANFVEEKTLNVNILRLREKIEDNPKEPVFIKTIFGLGYKWSDVNEL